MLREMPSRSSSASGQRFFCVYVRIVYAFFMCGICGQRQLPASGQSLCVYMQYIYVYMCGTCRERFLPSRSSSASSQCLGARMCGMCMYGRGTFAAVSVLIPLSHAIRIAL
jgi:hypothetical protein